MVGKKGDPLADPKMWGRCGVTAVAGERALGSGLAFCLPPPLWILVSALGISMPHIRAAFLSPLISLESRPKWGGSSAGRALRSQCRGRGFDPLPLHQSRNGRNFRPFSFMAGTPAKRVYPVLLLE